MYISCCYTFMFSSMIEHLISFKIASASDNNLKENRDWIVVTVSSFNCQRRYEGSYSLSLSMKLRYEEYYPLDTVSLRELILQTRISMAYAAWLENRYDVAISLYTYPEFCPSTYFMHPRGQRQLQPLSNTNETQEEMKILKIGSDDDVIFLALISHNAAPCTDEFGILHFTCDAPTLKVNPVVP